MHTRMRQTKLTSYQLYAYRTFTFCVCIIRMCYVHVWMKGFPVVGVGVARTWLVRNAGLPHPLYPHVFRHVTTRQRRWTRARRHRQGITGRIHLTIPRISQAWSNIILKIKSNAYYEACNTRYRQDLLPITYTCCSENRKIRGLKFRSLQWRHVATQR